MAKKSKKRLKAAAAKAARKASMVAGFDDISKAPSKYRIRRAERRRGVPMKSRPYPPWWTSGLSFVEMTHAGNAGVES